MWNRKRSAEGSTELIALQDLPLVCEVVPGIQLIVADKLEHDAMKLVSAGFRR
jgi:hypothetical protein